jgi:hypothetical protein
MNITFKRFYMGLVAIIALAAIVGCAGTPTQESAGQYFDDTAITTKVKTAIFKDESLKSAEINVETFKGIVQLSGFVASAEDIPHAMLVAGSVSGVRAIKNDLRLKRAVIGSLDDIEAMLPGTAGTQVRPHGTAA